MAIEIVDLPVKTWWCSITEVINHLAYQWSVAGAGRHRKVVHRCLFDDSFPAFSRFQLFGIYRYYIIITHLTVLQPTTHSTWLFFCLTTPCFFFPSVFRLHRTAPAPVARPARRPDMRIQLIRSRKLPDDFDDFSSKSVSSISLHSDDQMWRFLGNPCATWRFSSLAKSAN